MDKGTKKNEFLFVLDNVKKYYSFQEGIFLKAKAYIKAVDEISLFIKRGEVLGLVGESGCGKSTLGRLILRLEEPTQGKIYYEGENILNFSLERMRLLRKEMQIIFQDPFSSLNPRKNVGQIIAEPLNIHKRYTKSERESIVVNLMKEVSLRTEEIKKYPHEFSGGQRQRIGIARALALNPKFIVCDEPVSALDVSIQSQVINLLKDLKNKYNLTYLFISHDLSVVKHISDRVAVMYLGKILELCKTKDIYLKSKHPYTTALIAASPIPDPTIKRDRIILKGDVQSNIEGIHGCNFYARCPKSIEECKDKLPQLREIDPGHFIRCFLYN